MKIQFSNDVKFKLKRKIKGVFECARKVLGQPKDISIEVLFVGPEEIKQLNAKTRGVDSVTDVLSYPMIEIEAGKSINLDDYKVDMVEGKLLLGSIIICEDRAAMQAFEYGHSVEREICFLALHGFLHCLGYDHIEEDDEELMQSIAELVLIRKKLTRGKNG